MKRRDPGNEVPSSLASESKKKCREPLVIRLINGSLKICEGNENLTTKLLLNSNYFIFRYHLMERCWSWNPVFRPHFENIRQRMQTYIEKKVCE